MLISDRRDVPGLVDRVLDNLGRQRRIAAIMPQMLIALAAVS
jgi:hypothetical protein